MASMVRGWIEGEECAKEMLNRVLTERPLLLIPPLHRVPLGVGNVVEIVGPSPSAKTNILIQAAISCILPKDWKGVHYGGLQRLVMFVDLDCRFDILRLSQSLEHRLIQANNGSRTNTSWELSQYNSNEPHNAYDKELFVACMRRFLYIRCYESLEFIATLKTMHYQLQKEKETHGTGVLLLMIDSIGSFYWMDRASPLYPLGGNNRKRFSLQIMSETVVQEIQKLLLVHPMLVLATKTTKLGDIYSTNEVKRSPRKFPAQNASYLRTLRSDPKKVSYREYMPSVWQSFVTHRILVRASDQSNHHPIYLSEWLLPTLSLSDKFVIRDDGVVIVS